jgi:fatty-acyl-CoA synthase
MPLTPIGKVFKPALRWDAIRGSQGRRGQGLWSLATVSVKPAASTSKKQIEEKVEEIPARYTIRYRLETA